MNSNINIDQIISNFLTGTLTDFEKKKLKEWENESDQNAYQLKKLTTLWKEISIDRKTINSSYIKRKIWHEGVEQNLNSPKKEKHRFIQLFDLRKIAVAFIIFSIIGILYLISQNFANTELIPTDNEYVEKANPSGQKSKIFLSDGSVVWLNAKSSISYYKHFSDSARIVSLDGEAFFEVAKDSLNPFIVKTNGVSVEVIGTQFNVNSRISEKEVSVALIEGVIKVFTNTNVIGSEGKVINPGEGLTINYLHNSIDNFTFDPSNFTNPYSNWKDGILVFNGESYQEFISKIELWYGIEVQVEGVPSVNWKIRGDFNNESLENILKSISYNKEFTYKIDRKKLLLNFKK